MTAAAVTFQKLNHEPAGPGEEVRFSFTCPLSKTGHSCSGLLIIGRSGIPHHPQGQNGGAAQWQWDGNRDNPTFHPSINCKGCWHGYIINGRCTDTSKTKDMPAP